ncbi:MAG TPA: acetate/propionate family kinase, partial [Candidatus Sulfotelmatobacter sp.]|nr:acetate/propionate family kinase [Candidatus Sulfotelmatobacter sp.]
MSTLALNAGSTSLKFGLFEEATADPLLAGEIDWAHGDREHAQLVLHPRQGAVTRSTVSVPKDEAAAAFAVQATLATLAPRQAGNSAIQAVGHRVVHGGTDFRQSVRIDSTVKTAIGRLCDLAPLHNPPALKAIEAAEAALPGVPQVAVFDTAFYTDLPPKTYLFALPYEWYANWGIRRFGFHGISHAYCASRTAEILGRDPSQLRLVSCHLGGGCSATAIRGGVAVATTMGFSPLEGLPMGSRCGSVDPGLLLYLQRERGLTLQELDHALTHQSGLRGVSGLSADLAKIEVAAAQGHERSQLAFDMFAERVRSAIGALAASLGGLDAVIFTDRIGERSPALRSA